MALIPKGPDQGKVLVWDHTHYAGDNLPPCFPPLPQGQTRVHRWAIVDPTPPITQNSFRNYCMFMPTGEGDLFCSGHT